MTFGKTNVVAIVLACCFCIPISGQSPSWNGTWALKSDSQEAKPEMSFISKSDGTYELVSSSAIYRFRCDGKSYPGFSRSGRPGIGDAICISLTHTSLDITFQVKDKPPTVGHLRVSADAKGLTSTLETSGTSGKKEAKVRHYTRLSGTDGLTGGWRNVDPNPSQVLKVDLSQQTITLEYPLAHQTAPLPLSGAEIHPIVNGAPAKGTQTLQFVDAHSFRSATLQGGVVIGRSSFSLSIDGSTITEQFWLDQHPEEVAQYTYRRSQ